MATVVAAGIASEYGNQIMLENEGSDNDFWNRQLLTHLRHLRSAGVQWLPVGPPLEVSRPPVSGPLDDAASPVPQEPAAGVSLDQRRRALKTLADEVKTCTRCAELCSTRTQTVFADGQPGAELCFLGEAPGADEDKQGIPFVGAAGQLLDKIIVAAGFRREEVYICNILKCRPPNNRTPLADEAANCRDFLERQLALVQPKFIVALGGCAATNLLQTTLSVGKLRGRFHDYQGIPVMVTYHPSFLLRQIKPSAKRDVWNDMKMLLEKMGRPVPQKS